MEGIFWLLTKLVGVWTTEIKYYTKQWNDPVISNLFCFKDIYRFNFVSEAIPGKAAKASNQFSSVLKTGHHAAGTW